MKITFLGAAEMVTGSCYLLEFESINVLIDCGMFQGGSEEEDMNFDDFKFNPADIDYLLLTHAHIDHSGRIPLLVKRGFTGRIITSIPTADLCKIMLPDSGYIQEMENEWINRKRRRAGKSEIDPLYTAEDATNSLQFIDTIDYNEFINIDNSISVRYKNAGHILGSAIIEIWVREKGNEFKIVFSGDLGNKDVSILDDPAIIEDADYLILESTYGDRLHKDKLNKALLLLDIITDTIEKGGNIVIPTFAIERAQEILYELNKLKESKSSKIQEIPVFLDSPLAINATRIFKNSVKYMDSETQLLIQKGDDPFDFPNLVFTETADESKGINTHTGSSIILSASGMCEAGRIKHHLKHNLWREDSCVVFVGYQAKGTLGRRLIEGEKNVKIFGEEINVKCKIYSIEGFSGHADQSGLLEWLSGFKIKPTKIFLVHGEGNGLTGLSEKIKNDFAIENEIVKLGQIVELTSKTKATVIGERYFAQKQNIIVNIEDVKNRFNETFVKLQKYVDNKENVKLDELLYMIEEIDKDIKGIDTEINKKS